MSEIKLGYCRVSSVGQDLQIQIDKLKNAGVEDSDIFKDKQSGKNMNRVGMQNLLAEIKIIKAGERRNGVKPINVYVTKMDRMGRSTLDFLKLMKEFKDLGVVVNFIDEGLMTGNATSELILNILSCVAESERVRINERCEEGRQAKFANGTDNFGAKRSIDRNKVVELYAQEVGVSKICNQLDIKSRSSVYRILREEGAMS